MLWGAIYHYDIMIMVKITVEMYMLVIWKTRLAEIPVALYGQCLTKTVTENFQVWIDY